jgi:hypothetical protein
LVGAVGRGQLRHAGPRVDVLNAIVMELQRTQGARVKLTLEIEAVADEGFSDNDVSVVKDNARQLKFKPESTGFED